MTTYIYKAKKNTAETVTGQITAQSQEEAIDLITQLGFLPVSVEEKNLKDSVDVGRVLNVKRKDIYIFTRQLSNLLKSGVSLLRALVIMEDQTQNPYFKRVINAMSAEIRNGRSFSETLSNYPKIFDSLYSTMVKAGEESGDLQKMLYSLAIYQQRQEEVKSKIRGAMAYPVLMGVVGLITVYVMLTFVLPKMSGLFSSVGQLPLPTVILLKISHVFQKFWYIILLGATVLGLLIYRWTKTSAGQKALSQMLLKFPIFGDLILKSELARFSRTLSLLLKSGSSLNRALPVVIPILSNNVIKAHLWRCNEELTAGGSLGESIKQSSDLPSMMGHLIAVGEESGNMEESLSEIADGYEQETEEKIKMATSLLEPIMILTVGVVIGFIVFAILLPIFQIDVLAH